MNKDFLPIIGEFKDTEFILNIISIIDGEILIKTNNVIIIEKLQKYKCKRLILKVSYPHTIISFIYKNQENKITVDIPRDTFPSINVFNCDNHYLEQTNLWERALKANFNFHLGDQLYLDNLFMTHARDLEDNKNINLRKDVYFEYIKAFSRKTHVLQTGFNIMLGDDHDIVDESIRSKYKEKTVHYLVNEYKEIFLEIQYSLRFGGNVVQCGAMDFFLFDNIEALSYKNYLSKLHNSLKQYKSLNQILYILSPRVPLNFKAPFIYKTIFEGQSDKTDYSDFYNFLFELPQKVIILCGDAHIHKSFQIKKKEKIIDLFLVGTMNSPIDRIKLDENIWYDQSIQCKNTAINSKNSFLELKFGEITIHFDKPRNSQIISYALKYFKARFL